FADLLTDLAALHLALLLGRLNPALALARVLPRAGVPRAVASALAFAGIDALTLDLVVVRRGRDQRRRRAEQAGRHGCDERALRRHLSSSFPHFVQMGRYRVVELSSSKPGHCLLSRLPAVAMFVRRTHQLEEFQEGSCPSQKRG